MALNAVSALHCVVRCARPSYYQAGFTNLAYSYACQLKRALYLPSTIRMDEAISIRSVIPQRHEDNSVPPGPGPGGALLGRKAAV